MSDLGEVRSVHRPSLRWVGYLAVTGMLFATTVAAGFYARDAGSDLGGAVFCLLFFGALSGLVGSVCTAEFRKWAATRGDKLKIHAEGLIYERQGGVDLCRWQEIKDVIYGHVVIPKNYSPPKTVNVVRSIVKTDGTVIRLADTLDLPTITALLNAALKR